MAFGLVLGLFVVGAVCFAIFYKSIDFLEEEMINSDWRNSINQINSIKEKTVEEAFEFTDKLNLRLN